MLRRFHLHTPRHTALPLTLNFIRHVQSTKFTSSTPPPPPPSVSSSTSNCDQHDFVSSAKNFGNDKFVSQNTTNNDQEQILVNHQNQQMHFQHQQEENTRNNNNASSADAARKLADTMRAILPKYSNSLPIQEMQNKIKEERGIELEEHFAEWFLQNEDFHVGNFVDEVNSHCAVPRCNKVYLDLHNDLSAAASEALRLGSLPHLLHKNGKTLIDPAFGAIFTSEANVHECKRRHIATNAAKGPLFPIRRGLSSCCDFGSALRNWQRSFSAVLILEGTSGVGKTCAALDFAGRAFHEDYNSTTFIAYINLSQGVNYRRVRNENTRLRGKDVQEVMMESLAEAIIGDLAGASHQHSSKTLSRRLVPWAHRDAKTSHVVVVVDECGLSQNFLRGLVDTAYDLGKQLHHIFFADKVDAAGNPPRVRFIAAGSAATYSVTAGICAWDMPHQHCFNLDSVFAKIDPLVLLLHNNRFDFSESATSNLLRLSRQGQQNRSEPLSVEEELAADLCTNFRAAVCLLDEFNSYSKAVALLNAADQNELHKFRTTLCHILPRAVSKYCSMNSALSLFECPVSVLACAVAVDLHRLPFLPAASLSHIAGLKRAEKAPKMDLHEALCSLCGVVVDRAPRILRSTNSLFDLQSQQRHEEPARSGNRMFSIQNLVPQRGERMPDDESGVLALSANHQVFNRFQCSPAIRAMYRIALGIVPSSSHWPGAEQRFADLCMLLAPLSNIVETLYADINNEFKAANTCYFNPKTKSVESPLTMNKYLELLDDLPHFQDPLRRIKQLLVFEGKGVSASAKIQLRSSPVGYIDADDSEISSHENVFESARAKALEIYNLVNEKVRNGTVAVLVSPPMEQFADGIVVGPGKVILFQCKSLIGIEHQDNARDKISWRDELAKMGVLLGWDERKHKADKLRELWLLTLIAAASVRTNKREFERLLERFDFDDMNCCSPATSQANETDVSLHVVFFADCDQQVAHKLKTDWKVTCENVNNNNNNNNNNNDEDDESNNINDDAAQSSQSHVRGGNTSAVNFRDDLGLSTVDFVTIQHNVNLVSPGGYFRDDYFATSACAALVPVSTPLSPLMTCESSCRLLNNKDNCNNRDN